MTLLSENMAPLRMASSEIRAVGLNVSHLLASGEAILSLTATLTDLATGASYPTGLQGSPSTDNVQVVQVVKLLLPGHTYRLTFVLTLSATSVIVADVPIACLY